MPLVGFHQAEDHVVKEDKGVLGVTPEFTEDDFRRKRLRELFLRERIYFWCCLAVSTLVLVAFFIRLFSSPTTHGAVFTVFIGTGVFSIASYFAFRPFHHAEALSLLESIQNPDLRDQAKLEYLEKRASRLARGRKGKQAVSKQPVPSVR